MWINSWITSISEIWVYPILFNTTLNLKWARKCITLERISCTHAIFTAIYIVVKCKTRNRNILKTKVYLIKELGLISIKTSLTVFLTSQTNRIPPETKQSNWVRIQAIIANRFKIVKAAFTASSNWTTLKFRVITIIILLIISLKTNWIIA